MRKKRKVIAVTGARSEYDLLYSVYKRLNENENFDFSVVITGPHLSETFGYTAKHIEKDGFNIAGKLFNFLDTDQKIGRIISIGNQIPLLANLLNQEKPDIVLVAGDREESISVTMTCAYLDIAVAHFFGGDIVKDGNIDNSARYASSKFAHLHFPSLPEHRDTLLKLGEDDFRIFVIGNPALDRIVSSPILGKQKIFENLRVQPETIQNYCVLIQHPTAQGEKQNEQIRSTLTALLKYEGHCFINFPNSDAGSNDIIQAYQEYSSRYEEKFTLFKNLDRITYISLLKNADFLIGNSSSGVIEVASLGLAAINVGERQRGRLHGDNIIFTDNDEKQIIDAIQKVLNDDEFKERVAKKVNPYGTGNSADKVVKVLSEIKLDKTLIYKNITY